MQIEITGDIFDALCTMLQTKLAHKPRIDRIASCVGAMIHKGLVICGCGCGGCGCGCYGQTKRLFCFLPFLPFFFLGWWIRKEREDLMIF